MKKLTVAALALMLCWSCSGPEKSAETEWHFDQKVTREFFWKNVIKAVEEEADVEVQDEAKGELTSTWKTTYGSRSHEGERTRLIVKVIGDFRDGYDVKVTEEREVNTEQFNPDIPEDAEWEKAEAEGGMASRFYGTLIRRLNPKEGWREELER